MSVIRKYKLTIDNDFSILIPRLPEILDIRYQDDDLYLWALVDLEKDEVFLHFKIIGTGFDFNPNGLSFIRTVHDPRGFVWHVFYKHPEI